ncbi:hypothetical protein [Thalassobacillus hwangdonensis]|uniref:TMhelix containing protein n=1 Tax=Thalassobacillus hwangdonensis TaxID=546108 RepID=A0ABW3L0W2_9BACI
MKDKLMCYGTMLAILMLFFGGVFVSGLFTGVHWENYWIDFSWQLVNVKELKQIIGFS